MIYTVTFNPAIDYVVRMDKFNMGEVNRTSSEMMFFGGKGINVSVMLRELGVESVALGFVAGFTGDAIEKGIADTGVRTDFIHLKNGASRINVKIKADNETEINGQGPDIDDEALDKLYKKLDSLQDADLLVLSGSIPKSMPGDIYALILERLSGKGIKAVVDASGELLMNVLRFKPFLIKPNNFEISEIFGCDPHDIHALKDCAKKMQEMGAENVLISMAGDGALLLSQNGSFTECAACKGTVRNSVGAGDSMVAGFLAGWLGSGDMAHALRLGTAAGAATAFSDGLGTKDTIDELLSAMK